MNETIKFQTGVSYYGRFTCDYDTIACYEVVKRTEKTATLRDLLDGTVKRKKIYVFHGEEFITPCAGIGLTPTKIMGEQ